MSTLLAKLTSPQAARRVQDTAYALLVLGVSVAFMLFLLGSTSLQSSLTLIGVLLCLCLVGGGLRFLSAARIDQDLIDKQITLDQDLSLLQHRLGDHDLTLLKMAGQIETLETGLRAVRTTQEKSNRAHQEFMSGMKDRMLQLVTLLTRRSKEPAPKKSLPAPRTNKPAPKKNFFSPPPAVNVNAAPLGPTAKTVDTTHSSDDDDVYVSPALLRDAVDTAARAGRIDIYMQPIVSLPQQKLSGFDLYGRVRLQPGVYIPARQYRGVASHAGHQNHLDLLVVKEAQILARVTTLPLFVNMTRAGLTDAATLAQLVRALKESPRLRDQLVIQLSQRDLGHIDKNTESIILQLAALGVRFGVNDVQSTDIDLNQMARLKFSYLKLAHNKLVTTHHSDQGAALIQRFVTRVQARGLSLIASQIETREHLRPLLDYPIAFAQGYAFGRPDRPVTYQKRLAG